MTPMIIDGAERLSRAVATDRSASISGSSAAIAPPRAELAPCGPHLLVLTVRYGIATVKRRAVLLLIKSDKGEDGCKGLIDTHRMLTCFHGLARCCGSMICPPSPDIARIHAAHCTKRRAHRVRAAMTPATVDVSVAASIGFFT